MTVAPPEPVIPEYIRQGWEHHRPVWVEQVNETEFVIECECGGVWRRTRLADAAIAHERHQNNPREFRPEVRHPAPPSQEVA